MKESASCTYLHTYYLAYLYKNKLAHKFIYKHGLKDYDKCLYFSPTEKIAILFMYLFGLLT
jgi:hypothetical protein